MNCTRDVEALAFIRTFVAERGCSPTIREIGAALGIRGEGFPFEIVSRLEREGHIYKVCGARNIRLTNPLGRFSTDDLLAELHRRARNEPIAA
jgi:SOS-response transcriptional repressor LexA